MTRWQRILERFDLVIYDLKRPVSQVLNFLIPFIALASLGILVYYIGFSIPYHRIRLLEGLLDLCLLGFALETVLRFALKLKRIEYVRQNLLRSIVSGLVLLELLAHYAFGYSLFFHLFQLFDPLHARNVFLIAKHLLILAFSLNQIGTTFRHLFTLSIRPAALFLLSFALLGVLGACFLMMPEMTYPENDISFLDALFTGISATCVTGLIVVDTGTFFTVKGQVVIMVLMQFGGIGIITFASFFLIMLRQGIGIRHQAAVSDMFAAENFKSAMSLLRQIVRFTISIEVVGGILIFFLLGNDPSYAYNESFFTRVFCAGFHAISAFCNAGFSLFSESLMHEGVVHDPVLIMIFAVMIVAGGIGFPVLRDLFSRQAIRERRQKAWKKLEVNTTVVLWMSGILIVGGALLFFILEQNHTLKGQSTGGKIVHSIFQSVTTRTAGFNSVDIGSMGLPMLMLFLMLMFIGGSSVSAAGGIKTTTFVLLFKSAMAVIRNKPGISIRKRTIPFDIVYRAFSIFVFALSFVFIAIVLLTITDGDKPLIDISFEAFSAFNTVGLSTGITADLSEAGKAIIIVAMFTGRVGLLTLAFALSSPVATTDYQYPKSHLFVG